MTYAPAISATALRLLRQTPGFTAVAVLVLALGIGANTAVFSLVNALVLQPRPGRIDRLRRRLQPRSRQGSNRYRDFSYPAYVDLRDRSGVFDSLMAHTFSTVGIGEGDAIKQTFAALVSANYFETLGVPLAAGRAFTPDEERPGTRAPVAIASYAVWRNDRTVARVRRQHRPRERHAVHRRRRDAARLRRHHERSMSPQWWFPLGSYDIDRQRDVQAARDRPDRPRQLRGEPRRRC